METMINGETIPAELEDVYWKSRHRSEIKARIRNLFTHNQDKLIEYMLELELRVEELEKFKNDNIRTR